jgi:putative peptidoglycan lipid II flippase
MTELNPVASAETDRSRARGIASGAGVIASITIASRLAGLIRTLTFSKTVGATCVGTAYFTANQVPNIVYELVLGGVLGSAMVPVLARSAERSATDPSERAHVSQIFSALMTWAFVLLVPLTAIAVVTAGPIASLLNPANPNAGCVHADLVAATASMVRVFAPQAVLYGLTVVLFGLLQAYRKFAGYALAPLASSVLVIASYLAFALLGRGRPLSQLPGPAELVLSGGATLGVGAMVTVALLPALRLHVRIRPTFRFPPGVARRAGGLAMVGLVEMAVQQVTGIVVTVLANGRGDTGALVLVNYTSQVFNSVAAVLVLSIVLSAFPVLSARDGSVFDRTCAGSTRAVVLASYLGAALIGAVALPAARVLASEPSQVSQLVLGFALTAPSLIGFGVIANLTRALMVIGRLKAACVAVSGSWLLSALAEIVLAELMPAHLMVGALTLGGTIGMTGTAIPLVLVTRRIRGPAAVAGVGRSALVGLLAAVSGGAVGAAVSLALPASHLLLDGLDGALAAGCALIAFGAVALRLDSRSLRAVLAQVPLPGRFGGPALGTRLRHPPASRQSDQERV